MPSRLSYVWLSLKRGLGSRTAAEVLDAFGSPEAVFAADRQALTAAPCELRKTHVDLLCDKDTSEAEQVIRSCTEKNIQIITIGDSAYPDRLRAIPDPPTVLYVRGRWPDFDSVPCRSRRRHAQGDAVWPESRRSDRHNACPSGHDNRQRHGARQ